MDLPISEGRTVFPLPNRTICEICQLDYAEEIRSSKHPVVDQLGCGHLFHQGCLVEWVNQSTVFGNFKPPECPACRRDLREPATVTDFPEVAFEKRPFNSEEHTGLWWVRDVSTPVAVAVRAAAAAGVMPEAEPVRPGETVRVHNRTALQLTLNHPNAQEIILIADADTLEVAQTPVRPDARLVVEGGPDTGTVTVNVAVNLTVISGEVSVGNGGTVIDMSGGKAQLWDGGAIAGMIGGEILVMDGGTVTLGSGVEHDLIWEDERVYTSTLTISGFAWAGTPFKLYSSDGTQLYPRLT